MASATATAPVKVFTIPTGPGEQPIHVPSNELPDDSNELAEVLLAVQARPAVWMDFLGEYYRQKKFAQMEGLIKEFYALGKFAAPFRA